jgi:hypothetical protein
VRNPLAKVLAVLITVLGVLAVPAAARADSPTISVTIDGDTRCLAYWFDKPDQFGIADMSVDGRSCYVQWDWDAHVDNGSRLTVPADEAIALQYRGTISTTGHSAVWWKLCREVVGRDNCSTVRSDRV